MSITSELREWWVRKFPIMDKELHKDFIAIADSIDAEHERICYDYQREHDDWVYIRDTCWVELPKDADGVPIHIGDVMEFSAFEVEKPVTRTVDGIGQGVFFAWCGERGYQQHEAKRYCHCHAPTVEDVLREFANEVYADADNEIRDRDFLCAKYAKRLTLAEGEDA